MNKQIEGWKAKYNVEFSCDDTECAAYTKHKRCSDEATQAINQLISDITKKAKVDEPYRMCKEWGEDSLISWEDYIERRVKEIKAQLSKGGE